MRKIRNMEREGRKEGTKEWKKQKEHFKPKHSIQKFPNRMKVDLFI
jgi:hypothetical protein